MEKYRTYLLIGSPGSGKGTQGKALGTLPGFFHCACGDVFRSIDTSTPLGQAFLHYSSKGQLVPDDITVKLWLARIAACVESHAFRPNVDRLILDGIPRNVEQERIMEDILEIEQVFHLDCPDRKRLIERLKKRALRDNRLDDANEEVIHRRLEVYRMESEPLLSCYPKARRREIDALAQPHHVMLQILNAIAETEKAAAT